MLFFTVQKYKHLVNLSNKILLPYYYNCKKLSAYHFIKTTTLINCLPLAIINKNLKKECNAMIFWISVEDNKTVEFLLSVKLVVIIEVFKFYRFGFCKYIKKLISCQINKQIYFSHVFYIFVICWI